jgi:hypothetical protein
VNIGDDNGIGKFTSKNASVVDYAICSPLLFKIIDNFSVLEISKLFSDIHNPWRWYLIVKSENVSKLVKISSCSSRERVSSHGFR